MICMCGSGNSSKKRKIFLLFLFMQILFSFGPSLMMVLWTDSESWNWLYISDFSPVYCLVDLKVPSFSANRNVFLDKIDQLNS